MKPFCFLSAALGLLVGVQALPAQKKASNAAASEQTATGTANSIQVSQQGLNAMLTSLQEAGAESLTANGLTTLLSQLLVESRVGNTGNGTEAGNGGNGENVKEKENNSENEAGAGEEAEEETTDIQAKFNEATAVQGGDLKQDLQFTKSTVGSFEYEFQNDVADQITVTENTTPTGTAPTGFEFLETSSYTVALTTSKGEGLTLSKIDFIFDAESAALAGKDVTQAQVGRLCPETGAFVISESLGELEFEAEENEVTLNLNKNVTAEAEWGIFIASASAAGETGANNGTAAAGEDKANEKATEEATLEKGTGKGKGTGKASAKSNKAQSRRR